MKKFTVSEVLPHVLAVLVFLAVTVTFFSPVFFDNKVLNQGDITQFMWGSKELRDFRAATGEEGLWASTMFSGMPAYLVNLDWSDGVVVGIKKVLSLFLPHPVCNIFLAFICYYILLLVFRIRPYLAIAGALAFGLSSYMIIGLGAGHNARVGAIAFMPLVMAGIRLAFINKRILGMGVTAAGLSLQLRENHVQITYYLMIIVGVYGVVELIYAYREKRLNEFFKTLGVLSISAVIAAGTFFGPLWAITEYSQYSTRGKSELVTSSINTIGSGLPKSYAFEFSNGIVEPITALIPNFYGGSSFNYFINDQQSKSYQALVNAGDQKTANELARYSSSYWGDQPLSAPYYAGAIIVFLFALGCLTAKKKFVIWLVPVTAIAIMLSWGANFETLNFFLFDHLPGYNKFRSVTFVMVILFFCLPLLGMLGLEHLLKVGLNKELKRKLLIAFGSTGLVCLLLFLFAGLLSFSGPYDSELPVWFVKALHEDRMSLFRSDALRSFGFILAIFVLLYFDVPKKISLFGFFAFLIIAILIDEVVVDKRYFSEDKYLRKRDNARFTPWPVDETILRDKGYYRVFNLTDFYEANTSQFHNSLGGYNGVRLKRYQELYDSCIGREGEQLITAAQQGRIDFKSLGVLNMLNAKYFIYGQEATSIIPNPEPNGVAWFAKEVLAVNSPNDELTRTGEVETKDVAVVDVTKFKLKNTSLIADSLASITLSDHKPYWLKYESQSTQDGLIVFSEIYYPKGWHAMIDGNEVPIVRADYVLRALEVPAGNHVIEFKFEPKPYLVGDKITMASSWVLLVLLLGSLGWTWKKQ